MGSVGSWLTMRVAVTVEQSWHRVPGGTAHAVLGLLRALPGVASDLEVVGVAARHGEAPPAAWTVPVPVAHLALPRPALYEAWHLPDPLRRPLVERATGAVDLVHATAVAVPASRAPLVVTVHDLAFLADRSHATRHGHRFFRRGLELTRAHARLVLVPSAATAAECVAAGIGRDRLRVIPWGVAVPVLAPGAVTAVRRRHRLEQPYVLFAGTVEPRKNLRRLVEAFRRLDDPDAELVLVGPAGWHESAPDLLAGIEDRARALGFVSRAELDALMAGAALVAYPSVREGFGLPVLEAMAVGAPVLTSRGTATEEVAGGAAVLVDPLDVASIADAMAGVLGDPTEARALAERGRARAAACTWAACAEAHVAAYAEVADGG
ncbi:MAG: glycosyltransferase family 1 protein [Acidimicrobiales bacterium]